MQYQLLLYTPKTEEQPGFIRIFAGIISHFHGQFGGFTIIIHPCRENIAIILIFYMFSPLIFPCTFSRFMANYFAISFLSS